MCNPFILQPKSAIWGFTDDSLSNWTMYVSMVSINFVQFMVLLFECFIPEQSSIALKYWGLRWCPGRYCYGAASHAIHCWNSHCRGTHWAYWNAQHSLSWKGTTLSSEKFSVLSVIWTFPWCSCITTSDCKEFLSWTDICGDWESTFNQKAGKNQGRTRANCRSCRMHARSCCKYLHLGVLMFEAFAMSI